MVQESPSVLRLSMKLTDFVAIDFETANQYRHSICSIGIVVVRGGEIVERMSRLVRPAPNFYTPWTTEVHGLTQEDTDTAPPFPVVWEEIDLYIGDLPLIAHNKSFDESCLKSTFAHYQMPYPHYPFYCTLISSRRYFQEDRLPSHTLPVVARHCGYCLEYHHDALADAEACAYIALSIEF